MKGRRVRNKPFTENTIMPPEFEVFGQNANALFTLKAYRGQGMVLVAMNWKAATPPDNFVGFSLEFQPPGQPSFFPVKNRINFLKADGTVDPTPRSTLAAPLQKFRWVHFPHDVNVVGQFVYRVRPVFMDGTNALTLGDPQQISIDLSPDTYPGELTVAFTRGFVSSQAFVDQYCPDGDVSSLLPSNADAGPDFVPTNPKAKEALEWMGFESRMQILKLLDAAVADPTCTVRVVAYDLNEANIIQRLKDLGSRLRIIIDDSQSHGDASSAETKTAAVLAAKAGADHVIRQHMRTLQHNKMIIVTGPNLNKAVCGSTNYSWRGLYVQNNNAIILDGPSAVQNCVDAWEAYWNDAKTKFEKTNSPTMHPLGFADADVSVTFSPHPAANAMLDNIAKDIENNTTSSLFYSLAFLYMTPGKIRSAVTKITEADGVFVYGISDRRVGGIVLQKPDGNVAPVFPADLSGKLPEPFKSEPSGGSGVRMHHKFVVVDFDKPSARVYMGSYNFSVAADTKNGENLLVIKDRRIAVAYMIEALRIFDHYHFRVAQNDAPDGKDGISLHTPPRKPGDEPWWKPYYTDGHKIKDRILFAGAA
jgi:phospholipase D-like protein